ncbi:hypothetical protein DPMN_131580 [Dreissena polymorpha]|uniref:Uncharacterized protein n=1 Tax=Dreissena polymorpha TaxID=45954 RepID=A0A9D4H6P8_DREPO|nr:hypothetical protein DPMN_131580 [Dreissena polymorpha]
MGQFRYQLDLGPVIDRSWTWASLDTVGPWPVIDTSWTLGQLLIPVGPWAS